MEFTSRQNFNLVGQGAVGVAITESPR